MVSAFDWFSTAPLLAAALAARLSRHRVLPPPVEVHWRAEPSLGDRPGITLVQADRRVAPSGMMPATRCLVCAAT